MPVITIISDMGSADYYTGVFKGAIYRAVPNAEIIDITHHIKMETGITPGGYMLKNTFNLFPKGTIHVVALNTVIEQHSRHVVFEYQGYYFVGTDNGVFSLAFDSEPVNIYDISHLPGANTTFPALSLFVPVIAGLAEGKKPQEIGTPISGLVRKVMLRPTIDKDAIAGMIIYIDHYGNGITNIDKEIFDRVGRGREYTVHVKSMSKGLNKISKSYTESHLGDLVAVFNVTGNLEVAINNGNFQKLMRIDIGHTIRIEFKNT
jgi:S-adenosylmethionine hydrolase